jgi:hypothetical protein
MRSSLSSITTERRAAGHQCPGDRPGQDGDHINVNLARTGSQALVHLFDRSNVDARRYEVLPSPLERDHGDGNITIRGAPHEPHSQVSTTRPWFTSVEYSFISPSLLQLRQTVGRAGSRHSRRRSQRHRPSGFAAFASARIVPGSIAASSCRFYCNSDVNGRKVGCHGCRRWRAVP